MTRNKMGGQNHHQNQAIEESGQIITTSHEFSPQKVAKEGEVPLFQVFQVGELL